MRIASPAQNTVRVVVAHLNAYKACSRADTAYAGEFLVFL